MIALANAPVSYGVFELEADEEVALPDADELLALVAAAGFVGIDSGPIGMLGRGDELRDRLRRHSLSLAGGWVSLPFSEPEAFAAGLESYRDSLEFFAEAAQASTVLRPKPTLADAGSPARRASPGGGMGLGLSPEQWDLFAANLAHAVGLAESAGLEVTFHHHACTFVETPEEIDELLERTDVRLTLDTGHLLLGGGDPMTGLERWAPRINHIHLKDARLSVLDDVVAHRGTMRDVWTSRAFVPLGEGDLDLEGVMGWVTGSGYEGWLVVEQDVIPRSDDDAGRPQRHQVRNREVLRRWFP